MSGEQRAYHDLMDELADEANRRRKAEAQAEALAKALRWSPCPRFGIGMTVGDCLSKPDCSHCRALSAYRSGK